MKVEKWNTRFGKSVRTVERGRNGRFVNNKSAKQLIRIQDKEVGVKFAPVK